MNTNDRGAAALAETIKFWLPDVPFADEVAAAILGPDGCFLPDGLDALAEKVAALRKSAPWPQFGTTGDSVLDARNAYNAAVDAVLALITEATE